ncbi:hypothetical protein ACFL54_09460, partial [Planctomycetota bacterium]
MRKATTLIALLVFLMSLTIPVLAGKIPSFKVSWLGKKPTGFKNKVIIMHFCGNPIGGDNWDRQWLDEENVRIVQYLNTYLEKIAAKNPNIVMVGYSAARLGQLKTWYLANGVQYPIGCGLSGNDAKSKAGVTKFPTVRIYGHDGTRLYAGQPYSYIDVTSSDGEITVKDKFSGAVQKGLDKLQAILVKQEKKKFSLAEKAIQAGKYVKAYCIYREVNLSIPDTDEGKTALRKMEFVEGKIRMQFKEKIFNATTD